MPCWVVSPWSTGGKIVSKVSDHTSVLRLIESVAAAGGLSGRGPVTFPNISLWCRQTFGDLAGALGETTQPAPSSPEFDPATRAAFVAAQTKSSKLPLPPFPGADQTMPVQLKKRPADPGRAAGQSPRWPSPPELMTRREMATLALAADLASIDYAKEEVFVTDHNSEPLRAKPWHAKVSRRGFLRTGTVLAGAAAVAGYLPESVLRAQAASAATRSSFDLSQIKHLVFLMQENRSFDHYFGTYPGVAGFSDPHAIKLPDGRSVFQQPDPDNPDGYLEPFHLDTIKTGAAAVPDTSHAWQTQHSSWNGGKMDGWLRAHIADDGPKVGPYVMGYHTQQDIPFHWALAEAFTLLDHYHCSVLGPSAPNHIVWSCGTIDPQGLSGGPITDNAFGAPLTFESGAETLFNAGIPFKVYFETDWTRMEFFAKLQDRSGIPAALYNSVFATGSLFGDGTPGGVGDPANPTPESVAGMGFFEDCANGVLPDVSFVGTDRPFLGINIVDEHPSGLPAAGGVFLAQVLNALASNEDLWNTTALVIQYDENDGFFDHVPPPTPDKAEFPEEFVTKVSPGGTPGGDLPVGAGFRVPCWVVSPWSTGGQIFSEVSDHSSCLRLVESVAAAGGLSGKGPVKFPNISRWRRQTFSDLTAAFGGTTKPAPSSPEFDPATRAANLAAQQASAKLPLPPFPGADQTMPVQLKKLPD